MDVEGEREVVVVEEEEQEEQEQERQLRRLMSLSDNESYSRWFNMYFLAVKRGKFWIVGFWTIAFIWGGIVGPRYISEARDEMLAPKGSRADIDMKAFTKEFRVQAVGAPLLVYINCKEHVKDCLVACPASACSKGCAGHNADIGTFSSRLSDKILTYSKEHETGFQDEVLGFYPMANTTLDKIKCQFTSETGRATYMVFMGSTDVESKKRYALMEKITDDFLPSLNPDPSRYEIGITGADPMLRDGSTAAVAQSEEIDMFTMPFAFALLAFMVRSWRLLLVSLFNMGISMLSALGVLALLTDAVGQPPMTTTSSFVEVLGLAMSIDYSLFLLRRFRDESKNGRHPEMAIKIMLSQAGHVVMMSSLTIICVFAGFIFMRSTDLMVQGLACVVIITHCLLVNMTNTPALLLMFPHFFAAFDHQKKPALLEPSWISTSCSRLGTTVRGWVSTCKSKLGLGSSGDGSDNNSGALVDPLLHGGDAQAGHGHANGGHANGSVNGHSNGTGDHLLLQATPDPNANTAGTLGTAGSMTPVDPAALHYLTSPTTEVMKQRGGPYKGFYFRTLLVITKWPWNLVSLVSLYVCVIPLALQALNLQRNTNLIQAIPRHSSSGQVYTKMFKSFPGGMMVPSYVMVEGPDDVSEPLMNDKYGPEMFDQIAELTMMLANQTKVSVEAFNSVAVLQGQHIGYKEARMLLQRGKLGDVVCQHVIPAFCDMYQFFWRQGVNPKNTSALITVTVPFDPFEHGRIEDFIQDTYDVLDRFPKAYPVESLHFSGIQVGMIEDMRISFGEFPMLVGITCAVVFTLLGIMLQSAFVVVRLTLTVILPLAGMFGLSVLVYQDGILDWTGIVQLQSSSDGFFWYVPLLCFTICCGLALDYDVLVISRIREHRVSGMDTRASIVRAMWEINSTVVCAGLIMSLAFGGLMISDTKVVNQMSFILTTSVLFDTFVVQSCVVPCIMSLGPDKVAWWPGKVPTTNLLTLEEEVESRNAAFEAAERAEQHRQQFARGI